MVTTSRYDLCHIKVEDIEKFHFLNIYLYTIYNLSFLIDFDRLSQKKTLLLMLAFEDKH